MWAEYVARVVFIWNQTEASWSKQEGTYWVFRRKNVCYGSLEWALMNTIQVSETLVHLRNNMTAHEPIYMNMRKVLIMNESIILIC